ncbi:TIGR00374 family protein [Pedobacter sp. HMWF019]|uniref:lysylphosphatidylglycerol synthase transmembrane domain-containing protein n=1 Tax=Pedobacter sp. HMWF019 TaxID=2056856 RepID=UPI000D37F09B|nr:lysylphosphatidylglycerol synthase transmembrane domain-containing protein [Pedobacter sp. HMWF019]PTS96775.1 TIGR00374 family protein [Pedobacter sp. HMWF019]
MTKQARNSFFSPSRIVFYILSVVVFYFAVHYIGKLKDIETLLLEMSPIWLFLAVAAQVFTYAFNALILKVLLGKDTKEIPFLILMKISVVILFVNQALPTGGISGNGYVFNQLIKRQVDAARAFLVLVLESVGYYIAFLGSIVFFFSWYAIEHSPMNRIIVYTAIVGFVFYCFLLLMMAVLSNWRIWRGILRRLSRFPKIQRYIKKINLPGLTKGKQGIWKMFLENKRETFQVIGIQCCIIFLDVLTVYAILKGFHVSLPVQAIAFGLLLSLVVGALPISPGSLIAYESAMTYYFTILGAPVHAALMVTLIFRFLTFWLPIPIGLFLYRDLQRKAKTQ